MDIYLQLIEDLSKLMGLPLLPDSKRRCRLFIDHQIHVQIEDVPEKEKVLFATFICEVPPGKFREKVFKQALKENNEYPRIASFSYCDKNSSLAMTSYYTYAELAKDKIGDILDRFTEKALLWKKGIETGTLPESSALQKPSLFDIEK